VNLSRNWQANRLPCVRLAVALGPKNPYIRKCWVSTVRVFTAFCLLPEPLSSAPNTNAFCPLRRITMLIQKSMTVRCFPVALVIAMACYGSHAGAQTAAGEVEFSRGVGFAQTPGQLPRTLGKGLPLKATA
jgi:hypothetical protein